MSTSFLQWDALRAISAVDLAVVSDANPLDTQDAVVDFVDDSVVTDTHSVGELLTPHGNAAGRPRGVS